MMFIQSIQVVNMTEKGPQFEKINQTSVVQQVIDALTQAMIDKKLRPGDKIPTELELSESFGVGRLSIREAIKVLVYFGVLEIRRPEGTFVREGFSESMINPLLYGIILDRDDSYTYLKELRQLMEVGVIQMAIEKSTEEDHQLLTEKYRAFADALAADPVDVDAVFEADNEFHRVVSEMGRNPLVNKINSLVRVLTHAIRYRTVENMIAIGEGQTLLAAHNQICRVITTKDARNIEEIVGEGYFYNRVSLDQD